MALNFSGLGFNIGAKDKASGVFDKIRSAAEGAGSAIRGIGDAAVAKMFDEVIYPMLLKGAGILHRSGQDYGAFADILEASLVTLGSMSGAFEELSSDAEAAAIPLHDVVEPSSLAEMQGLDDAVKDLAKSLGGKLPSSARKGTEKFKRSGDGILSIQRNIAYGFDLMQTGLSKLDQILATNKLGNFIAALNLKKLHDVGEGIAQIGNDNSRLTTSFEDAAQQATVTSRKIAAGYGFTGKALNKATAAAASMSMYMGISEQTTGAAMFAMKLSAKELADVGVDSAETMAKVADGLGVDGAELAKTLKNMRNEMGFDKKALSGVASSFAKFGQDSGDVKGGLESMNELLPVLRTRLHNLKPGDVPVEEFARDTAAAAEALFRMTGDSKKAKDASFSLAKALTASQDQFKSLYAGTGDDLHELSYAIGISTGDIQNSFKAMSQGPGDFIKQMGKMVQGVSKEKLPATFNLIRQQLIKAMDPETVDQLMSVFKQLDPAIMASMGAVKDAKQDLGAMGKEAWRTSITLEKSYQLMEGAALASFRKIGMSATQTFVHDTGAAFKEFNDKASALAKEGGPLGALITKFSELNSMGTKALLPKTMRPLVAVFGHLWTEIIPTVTALGALGFKIEGLLGPIGLLVGLSAALYLGMKQSQRHIAAQDKGWQESQKALKRYKDELAHTTVGSRKYLEVQADITAAQRVSARIEAGYAKAGQEAFGKMLREKVKLFVEKGKQFAAAVPEIVHTIGEGFKELKNAIDWTAIWGMVRDAALKAFNTVKGFAKGLLAGFFHPMDPSTTTGKSAAQQLGVHLGEIVRQAFDWAKKQIINYVKDWWKGLGDIWSDKSKPFKEKLGETAESSVGIFLAAFAFGRFMPVFKVVSLLISFLGPLVNMMMTVGGWALKLSKWFFTLATEGTLLGDALAWVSEAFLGVFGGSAAAGLAVVALIGAFAIWPDKMHEYTDKALKIVHDFVSDAVEWLTTWFIDNIVKGWDKLPDEAGNIAVRIWRAIVDVIHLVPRLLDSIFDGIIDGIANAIKKSFPEMTAQVNEFAATSKDVVHTLVKLWWYITAPISAVVDLLDALGDASTSTTGIMKPIVQMIGSILTFVGRLIEVVWDLLWPAVKAVGALFYLLFKVAQLLFTPVQAVFDFMVEVLYVIWRAVVLVVKVLWGLVDVILGGMFRALWLVFKGAFEPLYDFIMNFFVEAFIWAGKKIGVVADFIGDAFKWFHGVLKDLFDWLEKTVDEAFGHSWFTDAFENAFKIINLLVNGFFDNLKTIFAAIKDIVTTVFKPITMIVEKVFGGGANSVPDILAGGMDKAKAIMQDAMTAVQGMVEKGFTEAVGMGIVHAFAQAFKMTIVGTNSFIDTQLKSFQRLALGIYTEFNKTWTMILQDTEQASKAMVDEIKGAMGDLSQLQTSLEALGQVRTDLKAQAAGTDDDHQVHLADSADQSEYRQKMLDLTNWPGWYTDYKNVFTAGIAQLSAAMAQVGVANARGQVGAAGGAANALGVRRKTVVGGASLADIPPKGGG